MKPANKKPSRVARAVRVGLAGTAAIAAAASVSSGCLDRPVAEQEPATSNIFVEQFTQTAVDKIDLLFMIDNSQSMQDKQELLAAAVPELLGRLLNPPCLNAGGEVVDRPANPNIDCAAGDREFTPVADVHIGVITSSLGGHGGAFCTSAIPDNWNDTMNDRAYLLPFVRPGANLASYNPGPGGLGFLAWDNRANEVRDPNAINDIANLEAIFSNHVQAAGEVGCGFEASLEAWYRFLVDPEPYSEVVLNPETNQAQRQGTDDNILAMRDQFLRPDSLVAIIMLTDENDCSIFDEGFGYLVSTFSRGNPPQEFHMPRGAAICATEPNSPCCVSCATRDSAWPAGCPTKAESCPADAGNDLSGDEDKSNLRCFDQKSRYGLDLLYPTSRYSTGLADTYICPDSTFGDADCQCARAQAIGRSCDPGAQQPNPLYNQGSSLVGRGPDLVFLAGIVGVPWQDIATDATRDPNTQALKYKTAAELSLPMEAGTDGPTFWDMIVGWPHLGQDPLDPFMVEDKNPRSGSNPLTGATIASADSAQALANNINGHEWYTQNNDLQYACIFPLENPPRCDAEGAASACDCRPSERQDEAGNVVNPMEDVEAQRKPLCQDPATGALGFTQYFAKAYPGLRELEVLREYGENSIVASVCPKSQDPTNADYGYNPAVGAIIDRLKEKLGGRCLPRQLSPDQDGRVPCEVVEATSTAAACTCGASGREIVANDELAGAVRRALRKAEVCDSETNNTSCDSYCLCAIQQLSEDAQIQCQTSIDEPTGSAGYCYVDPVARNDGDLAAAQADPSWDLVAQCPAGQKRLLRFVGENTPATGSVTFIACAGDTFAR